VPHVGVGGFYAWRAFCFSVARSCRQRFFWSLPSMYEFFKMTSYQGKSSVWISRQRAAWDRSWVATFGATQVIEGTMVNGANASKRDKTFASRCLPEPAASTIGVLSLLHRWSIDASGALKSCSTGSGLATELLRSAFDRCQQVNDDANSSWAFNLVFDAGWLPAWPRPEPPADGAGVVTLQVDSKGLVNLAPWVDAAALHTRARLQSGLLQELRESRGDYRVTLSELVAMLSRTQEASRLVAQILLAVACRLEAAFESDEGTFRRKPLSLLRFEYKEDAQEDAHRQSYICASYVLYTRTM